MKAKDAFVGLKFKSEQRVVTVGQIARDNGRVGFHLTDHSWLGWFLPDQEITETPKAPATEPERVYPGR